MSKASRAWDEAVRALTGQERTLAELRTTSLAIATLGVAAVALFASNDDVGGNVKACASFFAVAAVVCAMAIHRPATWFNYSDVQSLVEHHVDDPDWTEDDMLRDLSSHAAVHIADNAEALDRLTILLMFLIGAVMLDIGVLSVALVVE